MEKVGGLSRPHGRLPLIESTAVEAASARFESGVSPL